MKNDDEMYQSLLSRYEAYQEEKIQRKRIVRRIVPIAACFSLSVALGCGYWFHFRHIPAIPTLPETTEEPTTESPVTHPTETEANADPAETIMTETVIPTETAPLPTDPTEPTAATAATTPEPTQPSQTGQTQTTTVPPKETTAPVVETAPASKPTEPVPTEPPPTEPFPTEPQPTEPQTPTEALTDGFVVEYLDGCKRIVCTETLPAKTGTLRPYVYIADGFNLVSVNENAGVNEYLLQSGMESPRPPEFTVTQQEFEDFSLIVSADAEISDEISLDGRRGFCIMEGNTCTLYWFEENECFCISGADYDKRCLLEIARCFVPAEQ